MTFPLTSERHKNPSCSWDFAAVLSPVSPSDFFEEYWEKSTLIVHRGDPHYYEGLLSLADVDRCLEAASASPHTVLEVVAPPKSDRKTKTVVPSSIARHQLYDAYLSGDTIRLIGAEKFWNPIGMLAASFQEVFNSRLGVNLFLTPPHSQGFPLHFDPVAVFIIQVAGAKRWRIWEPTYEHPIETKLSGLHLQKIMEKDTSKLKLCEEVVLKAGDFFYMPRGFYHEVTTVDELSLHLTLTLHPLYWVDFLQRACEIAALEDSKLRGELPPGFAEDSRVQEGMARTFRAVLKHFCEKAPFEETLDSVVGDWVQSRPFPADGHFAALAGLEALTLDSRVERRRGLSCRVETSDGQVGIRFGSNRVQGPEAVAPAFEFVSRHRSFRVQDLPGTLLSSDSKVSIAKRLIREGLLHLATP